MILFYVSRPGVQREYVLQALEKRGIPAELGSVNIGFFGSVRFEELVLRLPEARVTCAKGSADIAWLSLMNRHVSLSKPSLEGVEIDFTQKTPPPAKTAAAGDSFLIRELWRVSASDSDIVGRLKQENGDSFGLRIWGNKRGFDTRFGGELSFGIEETTGEKRRATGDLSLLPQRRSSAQDTTQSLLARLSSSGLVNTVAVEKPILRWRLSSFPEGATLPSLPSAQGTNRLWLWQLLLHYDNPLPVSKPFAEISGEIALDGSLTAHARLDNVSSARLASLAGARARAWPDIAALSGFVRLAIPAAAADKTQPVLNAQVDLRGVASEIARFHPSFAGMDAVAFNLQGSAKGQVDASVWQLELPRFNLRNAATSSVLLESSLRVDAPTRAPANFALNGTVHGDALAEQSAWRDLLAANAGAGWRGTISASGSYENAAPDASTAPRITLSAATLNATRGTDPTLLFSAELLAPVDTASLFDTPAGKPVLRVSADDFPLELATPFLGGAHLRGSAKGKITLSTSKHRLLLATENNSTLSLRNVSFSDASGKPHISKLHLQSQTSFSIGTETGSGWELAINKGNVDAGDGRPLTGNLHLVWDANGMRFLKTRLFGDPTRLMRQPLLGGFENLESANINVSGEYTRNGACDIRLSLKNVTGAADIGSLNKITASAIGTFDPQKISLKLPLRIEGDLLNDLFLELSPPASNGDNWRATLKGNQLNTPDIQRVVKIFTPGKMKKTKEEEEIALRTPDNKPFWSHLGTGTTTVDIKKIILLYPPPAATPPALAEPAAAMPPLVAAEPAAAEPAAEEPVAAPAPPPPLALERATATLRLTPGALEIADVKTAVAGGTATSAARLAFHPASTAKPYALKGHFFFNKIPFQNCISLFAPEADKALEGVFDIQGAFAATVPNHRSLLKKIYVDALATSRNGRLRALKMDNASLRTVNNVLGVVGGAAESVTDILTGFGAGPSAKHTAFLHSFQQIQAYLDDFPFRTAHIQITRESDGAVVLRQLQVTNDQLAITGEGSIAASEKLSWKDCPLELRSRFSTRGNMARMLRSLKILRGEPDADGLFSGPEFEIKGSVNALENNLILVLLNAAKDAAINSAPNLLPTGDVINSGASLLRGLGL
ncbi:MAG: hypothetical protein LBS59_06405 [Puniceicoccales bacterium]|nr:hypothetical protein [Puniceicoccales bacterium]